MRKRKCLVAIRKTEKMSYEYVNRYSSTSLVRLQYGD